MSGPSSHRAMPEQSAPTPVPALYGASELPVERPEAGPWLTRCVHTLGRVLIRPGRSLSRCPEPIAHGRVLKYLATLRLPSWGLLVVLLAIRFFGADGPRPIETRAVNVLIDPALNHALSTWLVLMVPVGLPLLYFLSGLLAHIGIALTGGAPRSIGATMRAIGFAFGPALFVIGWLDLPLYLYASSHELFSLVYLRLVMAILLAVWIYVGIAIARTHGISVVRGLLVGVLPVLILSGTTLARAGLELAVIPGLPEPTSPFYVP